MPRHFKENDVGRRVPSGYRRIASASLAILATSPRRARYLTALASAAALVTAAALATAMLSTARADIPAQSFANAGNGECLKALRSETHDDAAVYGSPCNTSDPYLQWYSTLVQGNVYQLKAVAQNYDCLEADPYENYSGGAVMQWDCKASDFNQQWAALKGTVNGIPYDLFQNLGTGLCLSALAPKGYGDSYPPVIQVHCDSADPYQQWMAPRNTPLPGPSPASASTPSPPPSPATPAPPPAG